MKLPDAKESQQTVANTQPSTSKMKLPGAKESKQTDANTQPSTSKMNLPDCNESDNEEESPQSSPSKRSLTSEQQRAIKEAFKDDLEENIFPRKKRVVSIMKNNLVLRKIVNSTEMVKEVSDRVRYLMEKQPTMDPYELPEQSPSEKTGKYILSALSASLPTAESMESRRVDWSEEDTALIEKSLLNWSKCPRNTEIRTMFISTPELQGIFKDNTFDCIRNKVKNVFRRLKASGRV